jgi:hypothetical protein
MSVVNFKRVVMSDITNSKDYTNPSIEHRFAIPEEKSTNKITLILSRLWKKTEKDDELTIRAHSIKPEAKSVHKDLMKVLDNFTSDDSLYPFVREVVDPLLREIDQILNKLQNNLTHDDIDKYSQWTEKARRWVVLCNKVEDHKLAQAVFEHIVLRSFELIDRDKILVLQYCSNQNPSADVSRFVTALDILKEKPEVPLKEISKWKESLDVKRAAIVDAALHSIDEN